MIERNPAPSPRAQAAALQEAFPSYAVTVSVRQGDHPRFELVARNDGNPWCLISAHTDEIWRELEGKRPCLTYQS
jgi:hypothetical protein